MATKYGGRHQRIRARFAEALPLPCVFCGRVLWPGEAFDLDHVPGTVDAYRGVACPSCNRADGARRRNTQSKEKFMASTAAWLGVDTSNDRSVTSVAVARWGQNLLGAERLLTELHRFPGPTPAEQIADLYAEGGMALAVDGTGHMAALTTSLRGLGIRVTVMTAHDRAAATAALKDLLNDGAIRVPRDQALGRAVQHARERDLVGGSTLDKRRSPVDVSPLVALEAAAWAAVSQRGADYDPLDSIL